MVVRRRGEKRPKRPKCNQKVIKRKFEHSAITIVAADDGGFTHKYYYPDGLTEVWPQRRYDVNTGRVDNIGETSYVRTQPTKGKNLYIGMNGHAILTWDQWDDLVSEVNRTRRELYGEHQLPGFE